jgi:PAS domain S-box-containing protein
LRDTLSTGEVRELNCSNLRRTFQMRALPFRDVTGRLLGAILTVFDTTELLLLRQGLEVGEQRLKSLLNGAQALVSVKDAFGRYTLVNNAFLIFTGLPEDTILGKTDRELFDAETASRLRDNDLEVLLDGASTERSELLVSHTGEKRSYLASRFPLGGRETGPQGVGNVSVDATAQYETWRALEENQNRLKTPLEENPATKAKPP